MRITQEQLDKIAKYLPKQRGNVKYSNLDMVNAVLYVVENGCKWRSLPKEFGNWHTVYMRLSRWSESHVLDKIFVGLQNEGVIYVDTKIYCLDSTTVKVHKAAAGAQKKTARSQSEGRRADSPRKFTWCPLLTGRASPFA